MSDTPRTDAVMIDPMRDGNDIPEIARQLERELNTANTQIGLLVSGSKQQKRQIKFLQKTIQKFHNGAFEQQQRIQRLVEAGDKLVDPAWGNTGWKSSVLNEFLDAWNKARRGCEHIKRKTKAAACFLSKW